jgi:hypothetical protein
MRKHRVFLLLVTVIAIMINSCGCKRQDSISASTDKSGQKNNFVIVLDLSDRLLSPGQAEKDSAMIMAAFSEFEKKARNPLIVTSNDRFVVRIIPQHGSSLLKDNYENKLNIDLSTIDAAHKNSMFVAFKDSLQTTISRLYRSAQLGDSPKDYFGVDIWRFFHDEISSELRGNADNHFVVMTDGYFDFNDNSHVINSGNKYTSTRFLCGLNDADWQTKAEQGDYGLIPVNIKTKAQWVIAGIQSKNSDVLMPTKLAYFWSKWMRESGAGEPDIILDNATATMVGQYLLK